MGRSSFTRGELAELRRLVREKQTADRSRQKTLRARMRTIGFYISDFSHDSQGFVVTDLDALIRRGTITVIDNAELRSAGAMSSAPAAARAEDSTQRGAEGVAAALSTAPVDVQIALLPPEAGGAPLSPGFYGWWAARGAIAGTPHHPHPLDAELGLLYVGISPARASSRAGIRSRVLGQHVRGNTSSSTFRFVLASLLREELALVPRATASGKAVLDRADNERLRDWQMRHLRLTWCERDRRWEVEAGVITLMRPPLNSAGNTAHPFYSRVSAARAAFREAARR